MIHPSYSELIEAINTNTEDDDNTCLLYTSMGRALKFCGSVFQNADRSSDKRI